MPIRQRQVQVLALAVPIALGAAPGIAVAETASAAATTLSQTAARPCRKPPSSPPRALLNKGYRTSFGTNAPFEHSVDLDGDGWCDWISRSALPVSRSDVDEPPVADFIYLGTRSGWRRWGKPQALRSSLPPLHDRQRGYVLPTDEAARFLDPQFVYSSSSKQPFVVFLSPAIPFLPTANLDDIGVTQWDDAVDMLRDATANDKAAVIDYLKRSSCGKRDSIEEPLSVKAAVCGPAKPR